MYIGLEIENVLVNKGFRVVWSDGAQVTLKRGDLRVTIDPRGCGIYKTYCEFVYDGFVSGYYYAFKSSFEERLDDILGYLMYKFVSELDIV